MPTRRPRSRTALVGQVGRAGDARPMYTAMRSVMSAQELPFMGRAALESVGDGGEESELSDFDMVNDAIQDILLLADDAEDSTIGGLLLVENAAPFFCASQGQNRSGREAGPRRKRLLHRVARQASKSGGSGDTMRDRTRERCAALQAHRELPVPGSRARAVGAHLEPSGSSQLLSSPMPLTAPLCVVLDLDETLVWARMGPVVMRPYVAELIQALHRHCCEVIVWTAGVPTYVNVVLHAIAREVGRQNWFHHIISRHKCWYRDDGVNMKDIRRLGRPLQRVLVLENCPDSVLAQPGNAVLVEDFRGHCSLQQDQSLLVVSHIVERLASNVSETNSVADLLASDSDLRRLPLVLRSSPTARVHTWSLAYSPTGAVAQRSYSGSPA